MLRLLSATLATAFILTGCDQDAATQTTNNGTPPETSTVTSKDYRDKDTHFNAISTGYLKR